MTLILCTQKVQVSVGNVFTLVLKCTLSWAEDQSPHLGAVMAEDDRAEVPTVIVFDEILRRVGDLKAACSKALLLQEGLVQSKDDLREENTGPHLSSLTQQSLAAILFLLSKVGNGLTSGFVMQGHGCCC